MNAREAHDATKMGAGNTYLAEFRDAIRRAVARGKFETHTNWGWECFGMSEHRDPMMAAVRVLEGEGYEVRLDAEEQNVHISWENPPQEGWREERMAEDNVFVPEGAGFAVYGASDEHVRVLRGREEFVKNYCAEKGWVKDELTVDQFLEIRSQPGWKSPDAPEQT